MKISNETKTGVFVLICIAALLGMLIKVGNFSVFKKGYLLKTRFHFSGGVKKNAPVCLSGVNVGEVRDIHLLYDQGDTVAEASLWIEEGTQIRKDSVANVSTLGLMGEKYVEIRSGSSADIAAAGDLIKGDDPVRIDDLIDIGKKVAADIGKTAQDISKVANHVDEVIVDNRPKVDNIFDNLEETSENFNDFSDDVKHNPWKVLAKGKEVPREQMLREREARRLEKAKQRGKAYVPAAPLEQTPLPDDAATAPAAVKSKMNFGSSKA